MQCIPRTLILYLVVLRGSNNNIIQLQNTTIGLYLQLLLRHDCLEKSREHLQQYQAQHRTGLLSCHSAFEIYFSFHTIYHTIVTISNSMRLEDDQDQLNPHVSCHSVFRLWIFDSDEIEERSCISTSCTYALSLPLYRISNLVACSLNSRTSCSAIDFFTTCTGLCQACPVAHAPWSVTSEQVAERKACSLLPC